MTRNILFFSLLLLNGRLLFGQTGGGAEFSSFAARQDSLFIKAYEQRDLPRYHQLLDEFLEKFNKLSAQDQKNYTSYRSGAYYNLACTYGILRQKPRALDYLEKAVQSGWSNYAHLMVDGDLISLHDEERFRKVAAALRETGDYLYILGKAGRYSETDPRPLPAYTFEPASDSNLVILRKGLKLDSVAGEGSDVSRVLNVLHWIHNLVPHDGNHENPVVKNAMSLIAVCKRDHRGLNCRGLAIALNECYLSLGYPARYITCLPKDSLGIDPDCHVINTVYIRHLKKWIWIDPTNDAYVMNEKGELLGPEEVRQRLITHQPLVINPDANWNHRSTVVKEEYLYTYMAKNLYKLECPVNSGYDLETQAPGKEYVYVQLLPLEYFKQGQDRNEVNYANDKGRMINYHTNNPGKFWAAPQ